MTNIHARISKRKQELTEHPLFLRFREMDGQTMDDFSFVPPMIFFIMGFRDILESARIPEPKTDLDHAVNNHCEEDAHHWLWYFEDLKTLGMDIDNFGGDIDTIFATIWSRDNYCGRELVYRLIHYIYASDTTMEKLIVVDCIEAAFAALIESLNHLTAKAGLYDKLKFFGKTHYEAEAGHAVGSWVGEDRIESAEEAETVRSVIDESHMLTIIDDIFAGFHKMHSQWQTPLNNSHTKAVV